MNEIIVWPISIGIIIFLFNVLPWILTLLSNKVEGLEKVIWFIAAFFASWLGYFVFYFIVVRNKQPIRTSENKIYRDVNGRVIK